MTFRKNLSCFFFVVFGVALVGAFWFCILLLVVHVVDPAIDWLLSHPLTLGQWLLVFLSVAFVSGLANLVLGRPDCDAGQEDAK